MFFLKYRRLRPALLAFLLSLPVVSWSLQTHVLTESGFSDFQKGTFNNLSINQDGRMEPAPGLLEVTRLSESVVWAAVADSAGNIYIGTGNQGKILRMNPEGNTEVVFEPDNIISRALAVDDKGNLYVGTSPHGSIFRIHPDREFPELFYDPDPVYIWDMKIHNGALWVVTGYDAELWRVPLDRSSDEKPEKWFSSTETHLTTLTMGQDGVFYLGSSPQAMVFRVTGKGEGYALSRSRDEEITGIVVEGEEVYFSTTSTMERSGGSGRSSGGSGESASSGSETRGSPPPARGGRSGLYLRGENGFVAPLWQSSSEGVGSLLRSQRGFWLLGMDNDGKILLLESRDRWNWLQQAPNGGAISWLMPAPDSERDVLVFTSNPAAVYRLGGRSNGEASYTSAVRDATQSVRWGNLEVAFDGKGKFSLETRTGNTPEPDNVWSAWESVEIVSSTPGIVRGLIPSPASRYLQYQLIFAEGAESAAIHQVRAFLQLPNVAPILLDLRQLSFGVDAITATSGSRTIDFDAVFKTDNPERLGDAVSTRTQLTRMPDPDLRTFIWRAHDPNGDRMLFDVYLKPVESSHWVKLKSDLEEPFTVISLNGLDEGYYHVKVVASDHLDNPEGKAGRSERVSTPFLVDHSPPRIEIVQREKTGNQLKLHFKVSDNWSVIRRVHLRIDGEPPLALRPVDGIFDSNEEEFRWEGALPEREGKPVSVVIEVMDESGSRATHAFSLPRS
jgi:hypothetical protein